MMYKQELIEYLNSLIKNIEDSNLYFSTICSENKPYYINKENVKVDTVVEIKIVYGVNHEK